jgi:hypothetical protein
MKGNYGKNSAIKNESNLQNVAGKQIGVKILHILSHTRSTLTALPWERS